MASASDTAPLAANLDLRLVQEAGGQCQREAWRRLAHGTLGPVLQEVGVELADKLGTPELSFDLSALYASDLVGRVQAFSRLIQGNVSPDIALAVAGLLVQPE